MEETSQSMEIFVTYQQKIDQKKFGEVFGISGNSEEYLALKNTLEINNVPTYLKEIKQAVEAYVKLLIDSCRIYLN